jgi:rhamnose utilization protein RhaD (predicted bifunctional aldolase and dehydrogenase)
MLSECAFAASAARAKLAQLDTTNLVEFDLAKARALIALEDVTPEQITETQTNSAASTPCADTLAFADLFAFDGVRFALHTQPIPINQVICSPRARQFSDRRNMPDEILACGQASVLVPFMPPGLLLAKEIRRKIALWRDRYKSIPKVILIQNHGMIVLGETVEEVKTITEVTVKYAEIFVGAGMMGGPEFLKPNYVVQIDATKMV